MYDPLEVCRGVCIYRDPALCLSLRILLLFCFVWVRVFWVTFEQWCVAHSQ